MKSFVDAGWDVLCIACNETDEISMDLNPGPLAPKARIIPLDQRASCCQKSKELSFAKDFEIWLIVILWSLLNVKQIAWHAVTKWLDCATHVSLAEDFAISYWIESCCYLTFVSWTTTWSMDVLFLRYGVFGSCVLILVFDWNVANDLTDMFSSKSVLILVSCFWKEINVGCLSVAEHKSPY